MMIVVTKKVDAQEPISPAMVPQTVASSSSGHNAVRNNLVAGFMLCILREKSA
jgi:hypothetical protein